MGQDHQNKDADMHTLFEDIMHKEKRQKKSWKNFFSRPKSKKTAKSPSFAQLDGATQTQIRYQQDIIDDIPARRPEFSAQLKPPAKQTNIVIQVPTLDRQRIKHWIHKYKKQLARLATIIAIIAIVFGASSLVRHLMNGPGKLVSDEFEDITPKTVHIPRGMPEGFEISSSTDILENGAVLYTVHDSKGHQISITQQAKPANFDAKVFNNGLVFDTRLGKAYVIETTERITGYILTDDTMLLFNSTSGVKATELRHLMESFRP